MPCFDDRNTYGYGFNEGVKELHNSPLAEIMCDLCNHLETQGIRLTPKANDWWIDHKARDAKRMADQEAEAIAAMERQEAIKKLTPSEKRILNFKD